MIIYNPNGKYYTFIQGKEGNILLLLLYEMVLSKKENSRMMMLIKLVKVNEKLLIKRIILQ